MFAFIDESSFPRPTEISEHSVLLANCVKAEDIRRITQRVYNLKEATYGGGANVEIKAKNYIVPGTMRPRKIINKTFTEKLFEIIASEDIRIYAMVMEKPDYLPCYHQDKLPTYYTYLLQRVNAYASYARRNVSVIFDGQDPGNDEIISNKFYNLVFRSVGMHAILEMPLFVSSKIVPGIQLADIMAGVTRHYHNLYLHKKKPITDFERWIYSLYRIIHKKTYKHSINGYKTFGIHIIGKNALSKKNYTM